MSWVGMPTKSTPRTNSEVARGELLSDCVVIVLLSNRTVVPSLTPCRATETSGLRHARGAHGPPLEQVDAVIAARPVAQLAAVHERRRCAALQVQGIGRSE